MHPDGVRKAGIKTLMNHIMAFAATFNQKHPEKALFLFVFFWLCQELKNCKCMSVCLSDQCTYKFF